MPKPLMIVCWEKLLDECRHLLALRGLTAGDGLDPDLATLPWDSFEILGHDGRAQFPVRSMMAMAPRTATESAATAAGGTCWHPTAIQS